MTDTPPVDAQPVERLRHFLTSAVVTTDERRASLLADLATLDADRAGDGLDVARQRYLTAIHEALSAARAPGSSPVIRKAMTDILYAALAVEGSER